MSMFFTAVGPAMALVLGAAGAVALLTGRIVLPWFRGGVGRPGLWGAGALLLAGGLAASRHAPFGGNMPLVLAGLVLMTAAQCLEAPRGARPARSAGPRTVRERSREEQRPLRPAGGRRAETDRARDPVAPGPRRTAGVPGPRRTAHGAARATGPGAVRRTAHGTARAPGPDAAGRTGTVRRRGSGRT